MSTIDLRAITDENRGEVAAFRVAASQQRFVGTVRDALADAHQIYAAEEPAGFLMLSWNVAPRPPRRAVLGPMAPPNTKREST